MATKLSDVAIQELSLVFAIKDGAEWAPRNPEARTLGVKAGEVAGNLTGKVASWMNALIEKAKKAGGYPVSSDVPDGVDGDNDGADDYNAIVSQVCSLYYDLSAAYGIMDDDARSFAFKYAIDNFLRCIDDVRDGGDGTKKAGKRHSAADQAHIDALNDAHGKIQQAVGAAQSAADAMKEHLDGLAPKAEPKSGDAGDADDESDSYKAALVEAEKALEAFVPGEVGEDGLPSNYGEFVELCAKAKKDDKKPYGDVEYADPKNGKYPIDTKEHAKAAWSYINMPKNAAFYSDDELAKVKSKIKAACEKFGIDISDDSKAAPTSVADSTQEVEMTADEVKALVAEQLATAKAESQAAIDAANAEAAKAKADADAAKAEAEKAKADAEAAKADAEKAKADQKAAEDATNAAARKPTGKGAATNERPGESSLVRAVKAANAGTPMVSAMGRE